MIEVTCAIIINKDGQVLVTQRSAEMKLPLKMEFPGGKIEAGETAEQCLIREIKEELNLDIEIIQDMPANVHSYPDFSIKLMPFICRISAGTIVLKEHASWYWMEAVRLPGLDWAAADVPVMENYLKAIGM